MGLCLKMALFIIDIQVGRNGL